MSEMTNASVHQAARSYVTSALEYLSGRDGLSVLGGMPEWVRIEDRFELRPRVDIGPDASHADGLHRLPEFNALLEELHGDDVIASQLGELVGTAIGGFTRRWSADELADRLLAEIVRPTGELTFDEERFERAYERIEDALYATEFEFSLITPIPQLKSDALPVRLEANTELAALDDREIRACIQAGVLRPIGGLMPVVFVESLAGLRHCFHVPKVVGSVLTDEHQAVVLGMVAALQEYPDRLIQALRLLKEGNLSVPGLVYFSDNWFNQGATMFQSLGPTDPMAPGSYSLNADEAAEIQHLWTELSDERVRNHKRLPLSLRRFSYAGDRHRADDRLVDLMIAAEALFLPEDFLELGYKLALRAAFFIEPEGYERRETFGHLRAGYGARGKIVHGSELKTLKLPDGTETTLEAFTDRTADYVRIALKRAMRIACETEDGSLSDFDNAILR